MRRHFVFISFEHLESERLVMEPLDCLPESISRILDRCPQLFAGESEFLKGEGYIYSGGTTTCLQICLYGTNSDGIKELCVIHWNTSFQLNWGDIINQFQSTEIFMKI